MSVTPSLKLYHDCVSRMLNHWPDLLILLPRLDVRFGLSAYDCLYVRLGYAEDSVFYLLTVGFINLSMLTIQRLNHLQVSILFTVE